MGDGSEFGISINYAIQKKPEGLAQAFIIGEKFIGNSNVALALGDNIFFGQHFSEKLQSAINNTKGATIFGYHVPDPERFGVIELDKKNKVKSIEENQDCQNLIMLLQACIYDNDVINMAKSIKPSKRGEIEITDINKIYLDRGDLRVELLGRGFAWLDTGTHDSLIEAGQFVQTVESRQGLKIACLEEIAFNNNWISHKLLVNKAKKLKNTTYGKYLLKVAENNQ